MTNTIFTVMAYDRELDIHYVMGCFTTRTRAVLGIVKHCLECENNSYPESISDHYFRVCDEENGELKCDFDILEIPLNE